MTDYDGIYATQAEEYERLVAREDVAGHILPAIESIAPLNGCDVVEFGAGTGRITRLLAPHVRTIRGFDASAAMLAVARRLLEQDGRSKWQLDLADHSHLPVDDASADLAIGGWTICYVALASKSDWTDLDVVLAEMRRVLRPNGTIIIIETLGTGYETPHPPDDLLAYYARLAELGFQHTSIRTDYRFHSAAEAEQLTRFFFGDALADQLAATGATTLPECTGVWWRRC